MRKILFVINTLGRGGAENALIQLLNKIDREKYGIDLYVILGQGELVKKLPENVVLLNEGYDDSSVLSAEGKSRMKKNILRSVFRKGSIFKNIFYLISIFFEMLGRKKILADKLLWKVLSDASDRFDTEYDLAVAFIEGASAYYVHDHVKAAKKVAFFHTDYERAGYSRKIDRCVYKDFDRIFCVSDEVRKKFEKVYPECEGMTDTFENIIDKESILKKSEENIPFDEDFDGIKILTLGRLTEPKAIEISIEACSVLVNRGENVRWYVLGEGDLRKKLEEQIAGLNLEKIFLLPGAVDNPYPYLKKCDIYVQASRYEGKSVALREAQAFEKPMVVSDIDSNLEQVTDMEDALVSTLDPEKLADKIGMLIHDEDLGKKIAMNAGKRFSDGTDDLNKLLNMA